MIALMLRQLLFTKKEVLDMAKIHGKVNVENIKRVAVVIARELQQKGKLNGTN